MRNRDLHRNTTFIISRTDNIGDVILTLPMAGILKKYYPDCRIVFLGKTYTKPIVETSEFIDSFLDWDQLKSMEYARQVETFKKLKADVIVHVFPRKEIAKLACDARIPLRIGTSHRPYNWFFCNENVHFSRKKSDLHEAQLNTILLRQLIPETPVPLSEIPAYFGTTKIKPLNSELSDLLSPSLTNVILHPKTNKSAREWGLDNFAKLIKLLSAEKFRIFITGTQAEGAQMHEFLVANRERVVDLTGQLSLSELISFISEADVLVAASTGPLHIAAALGKCAVGLYAPMHPIDPQRWAPLGQHASYLVLAKKCNDCRKTMDCKCIRSIRPEDVVKRLLNKGNLC
ncbi:MAG: glycosyltransferase family 9 protein [Bacteroidota bacterium]|nr:glycosyltransferase family 9 protein [Bacteroidota bacterium]MDP4225417.1 glycosyltransferase family 9 protein [Bacteroidota bacterium]MDP4273329.1 glycosyltransferase family 9 protein [Bacteroidota bacterium]